MSENVKYVSLFLSDFGHTIVHKNFSNKDSRIEIDEGLIFKINANSNKIIVIWYDSGSGGNFLMNCLYLSDDIFINGMNIDKKISLWKNHLLNNINDKDGIWIDFSFLHQMKDLYKDESLYFVRVHHNQDLFSIISECENVRIIQFINQNLFKSIRNCVLSEESTKYDKHRETIPILPVNFRQFMNLNEDVKSSFINKFNKFKFNKFVDNNLPPSYNHNNLYFWDVNWYLCEEDTLDNIKNLYDEFNLTGFNRNLISEMYNLWIDRMDALKK
jgi:hypothetical protein